MEGVRIGSCCWRFCFTSITNAVLQLVVLSVLDVVLPESPVDRPPLPFLGALELVVDALFEFIVVLLHGGLLQEPLDGVGIVVHRPVPQLFKVEESLGVSDEDLGLTLLEVCAQDQVHVVQNGLRAYTQQPRLTSLNTWKSKFQCLLYLTHGLRPSWAMSWDRPHGT